MTTRLLRWLLAALLTLSIVITAFRFLPGGLKASPSLEQAVLILTATLLLAFPTRAALDWVQAALRDHRQAVRCAWIGLALLVPVVLLCFGPIRLPCLLGHHTLDIVALGERDQESKGSEVWIRDIFGNDGRAVSLSELSSGGGWDIGIGNRLISAGDQPASLTWAGVSQGISVVFECSPSAGKVLLRWDGADAGALDLYRPEDSVQSAALSGECNWAVGLILLIAGVASLAFAIMVITVAVFAEGAGCIHGDHLGHWVALGIIVLVGTVSRALYLNQPMRCDESYTFLRFASHPLGQIISDYHVPNNHILHTMLVRLSYLLFGSAPWAVRLPAFVAGSALIPAVYVMARLLYNRWVGLLAATVVAFSAPMLLFSTNARGYMMMTLFFVLLVIVATLLSRNPTRGLWASYVALTVMGFYTVPVFLFPFAMASCWLLLQALLQPGDPSRRSRLVRNLLLFSVVAALVTLLLYLPPVVRSGVGSITSVESMTPMEWSEFFYRAPRRIVDMWEFMHSQVPSWGNVLSLAAFGLAIAFHRKLSTCRVPLVLVCIVIGVVLAFLQQVVPPTRRLVFFAVPVYAVTVSAGLFWLYENTVGRLPDGWAMRLWSVSAIVIAIAMNVRIWQSGYILQSEETDNPYRLHVEEVSGFLKDHVTQADNVFVSPACSPSSFSYYLSLSGHPSPGWNGGNFRPEGKVFLIVDDEAAEDAFLISALGDCGLSSPDRDAAAWTQAAQFGSVSIYEHEVP